jgi:hypothetical protein
MAAQHADGWHPSTGPLYIKKMQRWQLQKMKHEYAEKMKQRDFTIRGGDSEEDVKRKNANFLKVTAQEGFYYWTGSHGSEDYRGAVNIWYYKPYLVARSDHEGLVSGLGDPRKTDAERDGSLWYSNLFRYGKLDKETGKTVCKTNYEQLKRRPFQYKHIFHDYSANAPKDNAHYLADDVFMKWDVIHFFRDIFDEKKNVVFLGKNVTTAQRTWNEYFKGKEFVECTFS